MKKPSPPPPTSNLKGKKASHLEWMLGPSSWLHEISLLKRVHHHFWPWLIPLAKNTLPIEKMEAFQVLQGIHLTINLLNFQQRTVEIHVLATDQILHPCSLFNNNDTAKFQRKEPVGNWNWWVSPLPPPQQILSFISKKIGTILNHCVLLV
jgi:hypothetical protein